jgi:phosphoribosylformylglycinamidine synthase
LGNIRPQNLKKKELPEGTPIVVLGGPAMLIGLGGGAASSMASGTSAENLDFASVQRGNPEMERRCQEVIDRCVALGDISPVLSIHDVGAGGISNAIPEIINDAGRGGKFQLRDVPNAEMGMAPMEIWCNEAQERYVLAIAAERLAEFEAICQRERAVYAVVGVATEDQHLLVADTHFDNNPVDMPMDVLLGKPPKMQRDVTSISFEKPVLDLSDIDLAEAVKRVLSLPTVASKSFLITIGDRSITGMVNRDQMVGPWQVPVADVAVTATGYQGYTGEAMAIGERTPIALVNPAASGRMAIGEAITNIAAANINKLSDMVLSANWMAAAGHQGEDAALFETVQAVGEEICPKLGICIPVGKDSLSMKTVWQQGDESREMTSPLSLLVTSFSVVKDIRNTLTPQLRTDKGDTSLILIDLGKGKNRMAASALSQVYSRVGDVAPDFQDTDMMLAFFDTLQRLNEQGLLLAYHDRSDGGLMSTLTEMAFAGRTGIDIQLNDEACKTATNVLEMLFNEELGAVIQVKQSDVAEVKAAFKKAALDAYTHEIGNLNNTGIVVIKVGGKEVYCESRSELQQVWSEVSYRMQGMRDNTTCADQEFERIADTNDTGLFAKPSFDINEDIAEQLIKNTPQEDRPKVAILREQGVNGQIEMAVAFDKAGFQAVDVHMTDILSGLVSLAEFKGLVACGGFSYGDVLGAGGGWAKTILFNQQASQAFSDFFKREDTFALGVCNGCQMLSQLKHMIPGASHWPAFYRNHSEQFEARASMVEIMESPSVLLSGMQGSMLPIAVAHGEGRAVFEDSVSTQDLLATQRVALRYVDSKGEATEHYPENPNGSVDGITGLCSDDGRVTIMMPHPERVCRTVTNSWHPDEWGEDGPWLRMFRNARAWVA